MSLSVSPSRNEENRQRPSPKGKRSKSMKRVGPDGVATTDSPRRHRRGSWSLDHFPPSQAHPGAGTDIPNDPIHELHDFPTTDASSVPDSSTITIEPGLRHRPHYSSLPPSPVLTSPSKIRQNPIPETTVSPKIPAFSLWDYVKAELLADDILVEKDLRWQRVSNFLAVPIGVEKIIIFGYILCLDAFLHTFTILPIRTAVAVFQLCRRTVFWSSQKLRPSYKADIVRALIVLIPLTMLLPIVDVSMIYHSIRGQDTIKLYVIFNALEIADRLFTSFGEDLQECLFSKTTIDQLSAASTSLADKLQLFCYFLMTILCTVLHSLMLIYQLTSLNVAINSFDQSLLTLLVSNQFVEIKGSVFKKFEKDNLFQITCADIVERFQLSLMLITIAFRIAVELSVMDFEGSILPKSFEWAARGRSILWTITMPVVTVLLSEIVVDWLKHAFITKFNHIRPNVYARYTDILCKDIISNSHRDNTPPQTAFVDRAPFVTRRLGLPTLPLGVAMVLVCSQAVGASLPRIPDLRGWDVASAIRAFQFGLLFLTIWLCLIAVKVMLGVQLITYALRRQRGMRTREAEDTVNDFGRSPIGEGPDEKARTVEINRILNEDSKRNGEAPLRSKKTMKLEDVSRFTMTKRIW